MDSWSGEWWESIVLTHQFGYWLSYLELKNLAVSLLSMLRYYFILFYFILFYFILFYFILFYFILFYFLYCIILLLIYYYFLITVNICEPRQQYRCNASTKHCILVSNRAKSPVQHDCKFSFLYSLHPLISTYFYYIHSISSSL